MAGPLVLTAWRRGRDRLRGNTHERRLAAYQANVAFVSSLGLDAAEVLGPPPLHIQT